MNDDALIRSSKICEVCAKPFSKPALLRRHMVVHGSKKPYSCIHCPGQYSQQSSLQRHMRRKHAVAAENESSNIAQHALAALKQLQTSHQVNVSRMPQTTLEEHPPCQMIQINDKLHPNGEIHLITIQRIRRQREYKYFYVCEYCAKEFAKTYDLIRHRRTHTKQTPYPCDHCSKRFATQAKLRDHQKRWHVSIKKHTCSACTTSYSSKTGLRKHVIEQHEKLAYNCAHCNCSFSSKAAWDAHQYNIKDPQMIQLINLMPQPVISQCIYKCIYCAQNFNRKFNCRIHMITHLRRLRTVKPAAMRHSCLQCTKSFRKPSDLRRHLLTHLQLKQHICHICQKCFTLKSTLSRHLLTHQLERNALGCQVCGKLYASKASLNLHLRSHTGERPFKCEVCTETFRTSGHKLEHMRAERHKSLSSNAFI